MAREFEQNLSNDALRPPLQKQHIKHYWRDCLDFSNQPIVIIDANCLQIQFANATARKLLGLKGSIDTDLDRCIILRDSTTQQPLVLSTALKLGLSGIEKLNKIAELVPKSGHTTRVKFNSTVVGDNLQFILLSFSIPGQISPAIAIDTDSANRDELTGLKTRGAFEGELQHALEHCDSENLSHVAGKIKVAHLNTINELCGSVAGDELLRQLTQIQLDEMDYKCSLYRLTGSEFGFLIVDTDIDAAIVVIDAILQAIKGHEFQWAGKPLPVSVNIGITSLTRDTDNWLSLMGEMDAACQAAVSEADNYYKIFCINDKQISQNHSEMGLISTIISSLQKNRLVLHVQKIVPVSKHNNIPHIEILVRMYDENDELLAPGLFLGAAETYNLILMIDKWVVTHTLQWLEENQSWLNPNLICNINLSGFSIGQKNFKDFLLKAINETKIKANKLCFEITETAAVKDFSKANAFIQAVKQTGAIFALDDFGSGMSSFAYLKNLKVDILKIDGTLIRQLDVDSFDKVMVQSIAQIARVMGLSTVAEFVENEAILQQLEFLGVDYAQGFHLCKPMSLEDYKKLECGGD